MATLITITIKDGDGKVVAVDQMPLPPNSTTDLVSEIEIVDVPPRARQKRDRNPLHPRALRLSDLHVGKKIRVHYVGRLSWLNSDFSAIVAGKIVNRDKEPIIPIVRLGDEPSESYHTKVFAADLGITPYKVDGSWNSVWYVTAE